MYQDNLAEQRQLLLQRQLSKGNSREFRDALTRSGPYAMPGEETHAIQWSNSVP